jgi:hypothetical protein
VCWSVGVDVDTGACRLVADAAAAWNGRAAIGHGSPVVKETDHQDGGEDSTHDQSSVCSFEKYLVSNFVMLLES